MANLPEGPMDRTGFLGQGGYGVVYLARSPIGEIWSAKFPIFEPEAGLSESRFRRIHRAFAAEEGEVKAANGAWNNRVGKPIDIKLKADKKARAAVLIKTFVRGVTLQKLLEEARFFADGSPFYTSFLAMMDVFVESGYFFADLNPMNVMYDFDFGDWILVDAGGLKVQPASDVLIRYLRDARFYVYNGFFPEASRAATIAGIHDLYGAIVEQATDDVDARVLAEARALNDEFRQGRRKYRTVFNLY